MRSSAVIALSVTVPCVVLLVALTSWHIWYRRRSRREAALRDVVAATGKLSGTGFETRFGFARHANELGPWSVEAVLTEGSKPSRSSIYELPGSPIEPYISDLPSDKPSTTPDDQFIPYLSSDASAPDEFRRHYQPTRLSDVPDDDDHPETSIPAHSSLALPEDEPPVTSPRIKSHTPRLERLSNESPSATSAAPAPDSDAYLSGRSKRKLRLKRGKARTTHYGSLNERIDNSTSSISPTSRPYNEPEAANSPPPVPTHRLEDGSWSRFSTVYSLPRSNTFTHPRGALSASPPRPLDAFLPEDLITARERSSAESGLPRPSSVGIRLSERWEKDDLTLDFGFLGAGADGGTDDVLESFDFDSFLHEEPPPVQSAPFDHDSSLQQVLDHAQLSSPGSDVGPSSSQIPAFETQPTMFVSPFAVENGPNPSKDLAPYFWQSEDIIANSGLQRGFEPWPETPQEVAVEKQTVTTEASTSLSPESQNLSSPANTTTSSQTEIDVYQCPHCDQAFEKRFLLNKHVTRKHVKRYTCDDMHCGKAFNLRSDLDRHHRSCHGLAEKLRCSNPVCPTPEKLFNRRDNLMRHERRCLDLNQADQHEVGLAAG